MASSNNPTLSVSKKTVKNGEAARNAEDSKYAFRAKKYPDANNRAFYKTQFSFPYQPRS